MAERQLRALRHADRLDGALPEQESMGKSGQCVEMRQLRDALACRCSVTSCTAPISRCTAPVSSRITPDTHSTRRRSPSRRSKSISSSSGWSSSSAAIIATCRRQHARPAVRGMAHSIAIASVRIQAGTGQSSVPAASMREYRHAPVAQLDRVLPSEGKGHRFESCRARHLLCRCAALVLMQVRQHRRQTRSNFQTLAIAQRHCRFTVVLALHFAGSQAFK